MSTGFKGKEIPSKLLTFIIALNLLSIMAVIYWSDLRFRVGIDLLLGCFAGRCYSEIMRRRAQTVVFGIKSAA